MNFVQFCTWTLVHLTAVVFAESVTTQYMYLDANGTPYISSSVSGPWVVQATFTDKIEEEGFTYLSLESNPDFPDSTQAYCAGYLEGFLTSLQINQSCVNQNIGNKLPTGDIQEFILENFKDVSGHVDSNGNDSYWYQTGLLMYQIKGMEDGYYKLDPEISRDINPMGIMWIYNWRLTELTDLQMKYANRGPVLGTGSCSAMIKNMGYDLVSAHVTWSEYETMLRTLKKYKLPFKTSPSDSSTIPGSVILESSYPGIVHSVDDYYVTGQKLVVIETTNDIQNQTLYDYIVPTGVVPYFLRISLANRLSQSGSDWVKYFAKYNSGTYNNQWMVVDYKQFVPNSPIVKGTLHILEQMPGFVVAKDMSDHLNHGSNAWVSYNIPFFKKTQQLNNYTAYINRYGPFFSHDHCPRANIFRRELPKAVDLNSTIALMRFNDYENDPFAKANCTPLGYSGENGISARCDLNPMNQTCEIGAEGPRCHGATDLKVVNSDLVNAMQMIAISGPTYEQQPVFDWSEQEHTACKGRKHEGHPQRFQFDPVLVNL